MKLFVTIYNDAKLLGHFLRHYESVGVTTFYIASTPDYRTVVESFADRYDIELMDETSVEDTILGGFSAIQKMRQLHQERDEWVVIVDLDEFIDSPRAIEGITTRAGLAGANVIRGVMLDRFSKDGQPAVFSEDSDLERVCPIKSRFIRDVMHGNDYKGVLVRGLLTSAAGAGHHRFDGEIVFSELLQISHYKWIAGALERLRRTHKLTADAGIAWAIEYQRVFDHYKLHGRFAWENFGGKLAKDFKMVAAIPCAKCNAAISESEHSYSVRNFGRPLCRADQKRRKMRDGDR